MSHEEQVWTSPLLHREGAVAGEGVEAGVAEHYGSPLRESRLLEQGEAVVDLSHRGVVTISGPDRLEWLNSLTTQLLTKLGERSSAETLVLSPQGHIEYALHVVNDSAGPDGTLWITTEPGAAPALVDWLTKMRFRKQVEVADETDEWAVVGEPNSKPSAAGELLAWADPWPGPVGETGLYGPDAPPRGPRGREKLQVRMAELRQGGSLKKPATSATTVENAPKPDPDFRHPGLDYAWREVLVPRSDLTKYVGDRPLAGLMALQAYRVSAWRPRAGKETDNRTIPHEADWLRTAVNLQKGCYRGQETVARVYNLGYPPRRLVFLHLDGSGHVLPVDGSELTLDGKMVGRLTSVARHHEDGPIALAMLRRNTPSDAVLLAGDVTCAQTVIVQP